MDSTFAPAPPRQGRPHSIMPMPAKMLRSHADEPDGMDVLHDMERVLELPEDDELAASLWLSVRQVVFWASLPAAAHQGLRTGRDVMRERLLRVRNQAPELAGALETFALLWMEPEGIDPARLADACNVVARWATQWGLARTAVIFAEAATAAEPTNVERAIEAGEMCQRLGGADAWHRAEQWFQRAFGLARVAGRGSKRLVIRSLLAYGNWAREMGVLSLSRKCCEKAARRARRYKRRTQYAIANHNLLVLLLATGGTLQEGEAYVQAALDHYPRSDPRLPHLAHDYAGLLNRHGLYSVALRLLKPLPALTSRPEVQPILYGSLAWAAAGAGCRDAYEEAVRSALPLASLYGELAAYGLLYLAEGALLLEERGRAREYAQMAVHVATARSDALAKAEVERFLARVDQGGIVRPDPPTTYAETEDLAAAFAVRLGQSHDHPEAESEPAPQPAEPTPLRRSRPVRRAPAWALWGGPDTTAELMILQEVEFLAGQHDESLPLYLWKTLRRIRTWVITGAEERASLFTGIKASDAIQSALLRPRVPALSRALAVFHSLLQIPQHVEPSQLAEACIEVGRWASAQGSARTAVIFAEVAALAESESAARAIEAGEACQRLGGLEMWHRAEEWFQRAFDLARVAPHSRRLLSIRALLAYGNLAREQGSHALARKCCERAAKRAWRYGRWTYYAIAQHNLLVLVLATDGSLHDGEAHAEAALNHYPKSDKRLPYLAHDYAVLLNRHRLYSSALQILRPLPLLVQRPEVGPIVFGSLAWAAAGAGCRDVYRAAVEAATPLIPLYGEFAAYALLYLAEGTLLTGDRAGAAAQAEKAHQAGTQRRDEYASSQALALLERINNNEPAPPEAEVPARGPTAWLVRGFRAALAHRAFQPR